MPAFSKIHRAAAGIFFLIVFLALCGPPAIEQDAHAQSLFGSSAPKLTVSIIAQGAAAKDKPLPVGAIANIKAVVRNETKDSLGPVSLTLKFEGMKAPDQPGWRMEGDKLSGQIDKIEPGGRVERALRLRIEKAPFPAAKSELSVEARSGDIVASGKVSLTTADCAGTFREKLGVLRGGILQSVRDAADAMRKPDTDLPVARFFLPTGARKGDVLVAERLAAAVTAYRGADPQMSREGMRFLIQRWVAELTHYSNQPVHPGLCANNYYQIAGYREGMLPLTRHLETPGKAAANALTAARTELKDSGNSDAREILKQVAKAAEIELGDENAGVFTQLAAIRAAIARDKKVGPEQAQAISLAETAAWLQEADKKAKALSGAFEKVLGTIADLHKESCVCAF